MKPKLLDLFCKAGGCSAGYASAGFEVIGVDIEPQPNYPYEFIWADAFEILKDHELIDEFDVIHASPPCQAHSKARGCLKQEMAVDMVIIKI
ncbi:DNA cytosine methyltransferase [Paenibacillus larvae]|uniref:DNA cytosine methyltransferase n=1 Tax=Paenibacillus larvae TaxID=1464 RepID=UPI00288ECCD9|nr:DNA cytosine methyltransferase [Paenibacillus larvae]MDT2249540.1 DNA cytosine methyltransferase [Paenibacillus larvae]MDT2266215.1 DNA cytosine methyltransferase [Paenibacillus larvae]MDT2302784.1 DNA cytosine methyltransferase [Paenibacillus larvae]MDV3433817.1 DNA cytosine methyltransferase [Paenibacillus larvae]